MYSHCGTRASAAASGLKLGHGRWEDTNTTTQASPHDDDLRRSYAKIRPSRMKLAFRPACTIGGLVICSAVAAGPIPNFEVEQHKRSLQSRADNTKSKSQDDKSLTDSVKQYGAKEYMGLPLYQWLVIVVFVIALLGAGGYWYYDHKRDKVKREEQAAAEERDRLEAEAREKGLAPDLDDQPPDDYERPYMPNGAGDQQAAVGPDGRPLTDDNGQDIGLQGDPRFLQPAQPR